MAKKPSIEPRSAATILALLDAGIDHTYHTAPDEESVIQSLHAMAAPGTPIAAIRRTYAEGRNSLLAQAAGAARALLEASGVEITGILLPNAVGATELLNNASDKLAAKVEAERDAEMLARQEAEAAQAKEAASEPVA